MFGCMFFISLNYTRRTPTDPARFILGVQWHHDAIIRIKEQLDLFRALVKESEKIHASIGQISTNRRIENLCKPVMMTGLQRLKLLRIISCLHHAPLHTCPAHKYINAVVVAQLLGVDGNR